MLSGEPSCPCDRSCFVLPFKFGRSIVPLDDGWHCNYPDQTTLVSMLVECHNAETVWCLYLFDALIMFKLWYQREFHVMLKIWYQCGFNTIILKLWYY